MLKSLKSVTAGGGGATVARGVLLTLPGLEEVTLTLYIASHRECAAPDERLS